MMESISIFNKQLSNLIKHIAQTLSSRAMLEDAGFLIIFCM